MKIAVPTEGKKGLKETVSQHFGRCKTYTIIDKHGNVIDVIKNKSSHFGGEKLPPAFMKDCGINVLLCRSIGFKALQLCKALNIDVFLGNETNPLKLFNQWKKGHLEHADEKNGCSGTHQCR